MVSPGVYFQVLYSVLCLLPLAWTVGVLPPLEALFSWGLEQVLTRLLGGPTAATDLRCFHQALFLQALVSIATIIIAP